jgi:hypothetical protein
MTEIIKFGNFKPLGKQVKKKQIILSHSSRKMENYLQSLKYRFNGKFDRIPNYIISKEGKILQLLNNCEHTNYFSEPNINRNSIIIVLENLGWLQKEPLKDYYINWIGDIYKGMPFERKWRDYFFWDPYTKEQISSLTELTKILFKEMKIESNIVGHNTKINGIERYEGLVTRSNFDVDFTDLSPAFDFEMLTNSLQDE